MAVVWWWGLIPVLLCQAQSPATEQVFAASAQALQAGQYEQAERGFLEVLKREPSNIGALGNLGVLYSRSGQPTKAITVYQRALKLAPGELGLILNLGLAYLKVDDFARAKPLFARLAGAGGQRQGQARELLAIVQMQTGEVAPAVRTLEELAQTGQPSTAVLHFLALGYIRQGDREKAAGVVERLFASLPAARAHYLEGRIWYDAALFDKALASYAKAGAAEPTLAGLALETGKAHISLRNAAEAEQSLRAALAESPGDAETRYFLGALLVQIGRAGEGAPLLEKVRAQRPDLWGTYYYLGKAKLALNRPTEAIALLEEAARHSPLEAVVQYQLARALQAAGRGSEAKQAFERVKKLRLGGEEPLVAR
ncbi:MAG: tetratricopeptide repeat protein, partial [Bryobacteraceae bacterium]|nr:tetratricopeptide repeat protein [Bryobacteraceae bacterium]